LQKKEVRKVGLVIKYDPETRRPILTTAFKLRKVLDDFIKCIILSSAINNADVLITEDEQIHEIKE